MSFRGGGAPKNYTTQGFYKKLNEYNLSLCRKGFYTFLERLTSVIREKTAFTLAEVLITLGIIGIVAALTIPNLMGTYRKKVLETNLQKAFSVVSSAIKLSEAYNESAVFWNWPSDFATSSILGKEETQRFLEIYIKPYLKHVQMKEETLTIYYADGSLVNTSLTSNFTSTFMLEDGTFLIFNPQPVKNQLNNALMIISVGTTNRKNPNEFVAGRNFFSFTLNKRGNGTSTSLGIDPRKDWQWTCAKTITERQNYIDNCRKNSRESSGVTSALYCTYLIYCNNWKIPEDYPIKL